MLQSVKRDGGYGLSILMFALKGCALVMRLVDSIIDAQPFGSRSVGAKEWAAFFMP